MTHQFAFPLSLAALAFSTGATASAAQSPSAAGSVEADGHRAATKPTIVLVHGAFADATGWQHVIPLLEREGYFVVAVQNPLTSLADDIATTKRVIDAQKGPVVVVGHSYGGAVITGAATGANVKALVYLAAFAPDVGEPAGAFLEKYPSDLGKALRPDAAGFVYVDRALFHDVFAKDVSAGESAVMAATQKPVAGASFTAKPEQAAWHSVPSWYLVSRQDHTINPDLERFYAKRMGATTTEIDASHVSFISHPKEAARVIVEAAQAPAGKR